MENKEIGKCGLYMLYVLLLKVLMVDIVCNLVWFVVGLGLNLCIEDRMGDMGFV